MTEKERRLYQDLADRMLGLGWEGRAGQQIMVADAAATRRELQARLYGYVPHVVVVDDHRQHVDCYFDDPLFSPVAGIRYTLEQFGRSQLLAKMRAVAAGARLSLIGGAR